MSRSNQQTPMRRIALVLGALAIAGSVAACGARNGATASPAGGADATAQPTVQPTVPAATATPTPVPTATPQLPDPSGDLSAIDGLLNGAGSVLASSDAAPAQEGNP